MVFKHTKAFNIDNSGVYLTKIIECYKKKKKWTSVNKIVLIVPKLFWKLTTFNKKSKVKGIIVNTKKNICYQYTVFINKNQVILLKNNYIPLYSKIYGCGFNYSLLKKYKYFFSKLI